MLIRWILIIMITELNLNPRVEQLFTKLEKNTGIKPAVFITSILNGEDNLHDLALINKIIEDERSGKQNFVSHQEALRILNS